MVDGFSGGISHKSRFVDRSNIPRKIGRPQFNGADKRVQTSGGLKNIRKEVKKIRRCTVGKVATNCVIVTSLHERSEQHDIKKYLFGKNQLLWTQFT